MSEGAVRDHFLSQARACDSLGSPFTARLCRVLARILDDSTETGRTVLAWPGNASADALALRLCGGLHALVLTGADQRLAEIYPPSEAGEVDLAALLPSAITRCDGGLAAGLASAPQTNEIARSAMLLPGFLAIARQTGLPLRVHEIGASAGLNLLFDHFHYGYGEAEWGNVASPVKLRTETRGVAVPLDSMLNVDWRGGCDIAPVAIADPSARTRLRSYVWADQPQRLARLDSALSIAEKTPPPLETMDAAAFVASMPANRREGAVLVLAHSIMWQYLPATAQAAITASMERAGDAASPSNPVAWLRMEPATIGGPFATLSLTLWPGGATRHLAHCDYHGRWIEWIGDQP